MFGVGTLASPIRAAAASGTRVFKIGDVLANLVLMLDAGIGKTLTTTRVDAWADANGNGNSIATGFAGTSFNPTFVSSLYGNRGGVRFAGNNNFLETAAAFTTMNWAAGWTILFAGNVKNIGKFFMASDGGTYVLGGTGYGMRMGGGTGWNAAYGIPKDVDCIFGMQWTGSAWRAIIEGVSYPLYQGTIAAGSGNFGKLQIGGQQAGASNQFDVHSIAVFNKSLSSSEIVGMTAYLRTLSGITALAAPTWNIVVDGNSLAVGYSSTSGATTMRDGIVAATGTPKDNEFVNLATSGIETPSLTARGVATIDPLFNSAITAKRRILIVWEITNDLTNTNRTDAEAYANIKAYCQARKAAGWKVIVCTCLPRSNAGINVNFETYRISINSSINTNAVSEGWADAVADIGGDATIGAAGASDSTTNFNADKIHLNTAGHNIAKTYITSAINAVIA